MPLAHVILASRVLRCPNPLVPAPCPFPPPCPTLCPIPITCTFPGAPQDIDYSTKARLRAELQGTALIFALGWLCTIGFACISLPVPVCKRAPTQTAPHKAHLQPLDLLAHQRRSKSTPKEATTTHPTAGQSHHIARGQPSGWASAPISPSGPWGPLMFLLPPQQAGSHQAHATTASSL